MKERQAIPYIACLPELPSGQTQRPGQWRETEEEKEKKKADRDGGSFWLEYLNKLSSVGCNVVAE